MAKLKLKSNYWRLLRHPNLMSSDTKKNHQFNELKNLRKAFNSQKNDNDNDSINDNNKDNNLKRSNSQIFDNNDIDDYDHTEIISNSLKNRRKSMWAFWKNENDEIVEPSSSLKNNDNDINMEAQPPIDENNNNNNNTNNEMIKDNSTWAFWSTSNKSNNPKIIPDVVKSNVSDLNEDAKNLKISTSKNIILPNFEDTLPINTSFNIIYNNFKKFKRSFLGYSDIKDSNLFRKLEPTDFKRVLIIGVHGFFPTKMIRPLIGEPTGTSMKFAQVGEAAILNWAKENNLNNIKIQKIALEKEGKIFDRVDFFFEILKNSINDIEKADFIFFCSHSQGTPVSIILLSKLLEYGVINENKIIGILGMAGINIGPFYGMDKSLFVRAYSTIENDSLLELFQFQNFESLQSRKYIESLKNLIRHNVKILFIGSIDDQLVPLYSAIAQHVQHPNLFKAVYIDHSTKTPDFVIRIIKLSCKLQNIGISDHDLIKEISFALAGPITGGGHSKIYNDLQVYKLALDFILKTENSSISIEQPIKFKPFDIKKLGTGSNPFNLPWCARGMFFEINKHLINGKEEIELVFKEFEQWKPDSKALKDVKYRLNGIKAKL
jgi:hypothetical protein